MSQRVGLRSKGLEQYPRVPARAGQGEQSGARRLETPGAAPGRHRFPGVTRAGVQVGEPVGGPSPVGPVGPGQVQSQLGRCPRLDEAAPLGQGIDPGQADTALVGARAPGNIGQRVHPAAQVGGLDEEPDPITQQQHVVLGHQRVDPPGHEGAQVGQRVNPRGGHLRQAQGPHSGKVTKDLVDGLDPVGRRRRLEDTAHVPGQRLGHVCGIQLPQFQRPAVAARQSEGRQQTLVCRPCRGEVTANEDLPDLGEQRVGVRGPRGLLLFPPIAVSTTVEI